MQSKSEISYNTSEGRAYHPLEAANPAYAFPKDANRTGRDETPDHLSVSMCINLLRNDANQLLQELEELRARLSPLLSEQKTERVDRRGPRPPARCEMAGELEGIHSTISNARESIYFTLAQLDL